MKRSLIVPKAKEWIGTPFSHQKSLKSIASDCAGLVEGVFNELGENIIFSKNYAHSPSAMLFKETVEQYCDKINLKDVKDGDLLTFTFRTEPQHIAIVSKVNPIYIIHAFSRARKVTEHILSEDWLNGKIATLGGAYKYKNIEED